jgi:hypothetical protein
MIRASIVAVLIVLMTASSAHADGRTVWTIVGAGAGFGAGTWVGFAKFDDAVYAERKIWTCAIVGAALGGVGGYFIGRAQDRRATSPANTFQPIDPRVVDEVTRSVRLRSK